MNGTVLQILELLLRVVIIAIGPAIITWIAKNISAKQMEELEFWAAFAVKAAEMIYEERGQGELKKEYVLEFVTGKLNQLKWLQISPEQLDTLIEGIVYEVNQLQEKILKK